MKQKCKSKAKGTSKVHKSKIVFCYSKGCWTWMSAAGISTISHCHSDAFLPAITALIRKPQNRNTIPWRKLLSFLKGHSRVPWKRPDTRRL